jgi:hypothetical protein
MELVFEIKVTSPPDNPFGAFGLFAVGTEFNCRPPVVVMTDLMTTF